MTALIVAIALLTAGSIALPHLLPLDRIEPVTSAAIWLCSLVVRAFFVVVVVFAMLVYLPETPLYSALASWCVHTSIPLFSTHLGVSGHPLMHAAIVLPAISMIGACFWLLKRLVGGWRVNRRLIRESLGNGPQGTTVIRDAGITVGVTSIGRSKVLISNAALQVLDTEELSASVSHEIGHVKRRHRPVHLVAAVLSTLAGPLPGSNAAKRGLDLALERDADLFAVNHTSDPLALASAICKAAMGQRALGSMNLAGSNVLCRLDFLEGRSPSPGKGLEKSMRALATCFVIATISLLSVTPALAEVLPRSNHGWSMTADGCHLMDSKK